MRWASTSRSDLTWLLQGLICPQIEMLHMSEERCGLGDYMKINRRLMTIEGRCRPGLSTAWREQKDAPAMNKCLFMFPHKAS